jgi:predicted nuclease with RNAse H fold
MATILMGVDVGFSATRPTTGIAFLDGDQLRLVRTGTAWKIREAQISNGFQPSVVAIDGPLLPQDAAHDISSPC